MRKLKLMLSKREWAKRANPCASWWLFEIYWKFARVWWRLFLSAVSVTRAVYFSVNATYFAAKHLKFDSSYSNYGMRGLSCWHLITRTQLFSFLFPLKPCHANLLNRVDHFLKGLCPDCAHARASVISIFLYWLDKISFWTAPPTRFVVYILKDYFRLLKKCFVLFKIWLAARRLIAILSLAGACAVMGYSCSFNMCQTEKYGKSSSQDLPELFYSFFLLAREKKRRQPSVWTT